jgi:hypothetical protein
MPENKPVGLIRGQSPLGNQYDLVFRIKSNVKKGKAL